ncbi:MAG: ABC transporter substrate-binding protein [Chloroflexota bacterium]
MSILFVASLLLLALPVVAQDETSEDLEEINMFLTFVPNVQFAPVYLMEPYLNELGYTMTIQHGDEPVGVDLIANGSADAGMISGEQVLLSRAGGRPVVFVYEWFQEYPVGVVIPETTGTTTIEGLEGKRVGLPGRFGASYSGLTALLNANGLTEDDVTLEAIGFAAPDVVCSGSTVDAATVYINNEPLQIQTRILAGECGDITSFAVVPVSAYVDMVSNGIVTSEAMIENEPEKVQALVAAFDAALREVINNPARAYLASLDYVENLPITDDFRAALEAAAEAQDAFLATAPEREAIEQSRFDLQEAITEQFGPELVIQLRVMLYTIRFWDAERLGFTDPESWLATRDVLDSMDALVSPLADEALEAAYTNAFLSEAPGAE